MTMGKQIAKRRTANGMTQRTLARLAGLTVNMISLVENGHRHLSVEAADRVALALMCRWVINLEPLMVVPKGARK